MKYGNGLWGVLALLVSAGCSDPVVFGGGSGGSDGTGGTSGSGGAGGGDGQPVCNAPMPNASWSRVFDAEGPANVGIPVVDATGELLLGGTFAGTVDFGSGVSVAGDATRRVFVARLDEMGNALWARGFDGMGDQDLRGMTLDGAGNLLLGGGFYDTIDFGGGPLTTSSSYQGFVAKLGASAGDHVWSKSVTSHVSGIAVDAADDVVIVGTCNGPNNYDYCVAKLDSNGNQSWSKQFGDMGNQITITVAVDASRNVLLAGRFKGSVDFGGGPLVATGSEAFVAKLDPSGNHLWSKRLGSGRVSLLRTDGSENVVLAGGGDYIDFGGGPLGGFNFVAKLDAAGNHVWDKSFGVLMFDMALDTVGNVFVTGLMPSSEDFGGCPTPGPGSIFLSKLGSDGARLWTGRFAESGAGYGLAVDTLDRVLLTGMFYGTVNFGDGAHTSAGDQDGFVAQFPP